MSEPEASAGAILRLCPVCGSGENSECLRKANLRLVRCRKCSMTFANPIAREFASAEFYDREAAEYYVSAQKVESDYADVRFARELRLFRKHCPKGKILDVGCGTGAFLFQLQQRWPGTYDVLGTDASGPALDYAEKRGVPVRRGNFLGQQFATGFDAVTIWAVLEHVAEPGAFLTKAASVLREGGCCFVLVPNMRSLAVRLLGQRYRYIYPQHLNYFTAKTLQESVVKHFQVLKTEYTHFNPMVIWQDWRGQGREVSNQERGRLLQRTTQLKTSRNPALGAIKAIYRLTEGVLSRLHLADNLVMVLKRR